MDTINNSIDFLRAIAGMAWQSRNAALQFAPLIILLVATFGVLKFYFSQEKEGKIDLNKYVFYNIIMLLVLVNYAYLIDTVGSVTRIFVSTFESQDTIEMFEKATRSNEDLNTIKSFGTFTDGAKMVDRATANGGVFESDSEMSWTSKVSLWFQGQWQTAMYNPFNGAAAQVEAFGGGLTTLMEVSFLRIVRLLIENIRNVLLGFLVIIGPFAILFEMVPMWRGQFAHWFKIYIAVTCWALTLTILDNLYINYNEERVKYVVDSMKVASEEGKYFKDVYDSNMGEGGFVNLLFVIMYIMTPYLTTLYAGGQVAQQLFGAMMSKVIWVGAKAVSAIPSVALGGKGGGGGKGIVDDKS